MSEPEWFKVSLKVVLKNEAGEYLLLLNPEASAGPYDLPGGRINDDEVGLEIPDTIRRELSEEIGPIQYCLQPFPAACGSGVGKTGNPVFFLIFEANYLSGEIEISPEHTGYRWVKQLPKDSYANEGLCQAVNNWMSRVS